MTHFSREIKVAILFSGEKHTDNNADTNISFCDLFSMLNVAEQYPEV